MRDWFRRSNKNGVDVLTEALANSGDTAAEQIIGLELGGRTEELIQKRVMTGVSP